MAHGQDGQGVQGLVAPVVRQKHVVSHAPALVEQAVDALHRQHYVDKATAPLIVLIRTGAGAHAQSRAGGAPELASVQ